MADVTIQISKDFQGLEIDTPQIEKLVQLTCDRFTDPESAVTKYEISIAIIDDEQITKLNEQFLGKNNTTDCLSFDLTDEDDLRSGQKSFDLAVNAEMAIRQAAARGHADHAELALYITHCLLHNLGFDDSTLELAKKMHDTENEILQQLGYPIVYN
ncbi:MAG: rRNA maturation RNase YbeY [Planctomycetota bacterium]|jgi:probable rRNA maturation factor